MATLASLLVSPALSSRASLFLFFYPLATSLSPPSSITDAAIKRLCFWLLLFGRGFESSPGEQLAGKVANLVQSTSGIFIKDPLGGLLSAKTTH